MEDGREEVVVESSNARTRAVLSSLLRVMRSSLFECPNRGVGFVVVPLLVFPVPRVLRAVTTPLLIACFRDFVIRANPPVPLRSSSHPKLGALFKRKRHRSVNRVPTPCAAHDSDPTDAISTGLPRTCMRITLGPSFAQPPRHASLATRVDI